MKLFGLFLSAVFAAKNEECPSNSEGAAERCESFCQELYIGRIPMSQTVSLVRYESYPRLGSQATRIHSQLTYENRKGCVIECGEDISCISDCTRADFECLAPCPCHDDCFDGCPCENGSDYCLPCREEFAQGNKL